MKSGVLAFWLAVILVGSAAYGSWVVLRAMQDEPKPVKKMEHPGARAVDTTPGKGPTITEFELTERTGRKFESKELDGQVWIASFFFANCPGPCFQLNQALKGVQDDIQEADFRIISITCDPEEDTPEALTKYANRLGADRGRWLFLTGEMQYIADIGRQIFKQVVGPGIHMNRALLIDRGGEIRGSYDLLDVEKVKEMKGEIRKLLKEPVPKPRPASEADDAETKPASDANDKQPVESSAAAVGEV